jgi:hypothetical protein
VGRAAGHRCHRQEQGEGVRGPLEPSGSRSSQTPHHNRWRSNVRCRRHA